MHLPDQAPDRSYVAAGAAFAPVPGVQEEIDSRNRHARMCLGYFSGLGCLGSIILSIILTLILTLCTNIL